MSGGMGVLCFHQVTSEADCRNSALTCSSSQVKHQQSHPLSLCTPSPPNSFTTLVLFAYFPHSFSLLVTMNNQFLCYNGRGGYLTFSVPDLSLSLDFAGLEAEYLCVW